MELGAALAVTYAHTPTRSVYTASLVLWMLSAHNPHRLQEGGAAEDDEALVAAFNTALHQPGGQRVGCLSGVGASWEGNRQEEDALYQAQGGARR